MKRVAVLLLAAVLAVFSLSVDASATVVETEKVSSLTFVYAAEGIAFAGLQIQTFRIADVSAEGQYTLTGDFQDYPVSLYDVQSQAEWRNIASTLASYAVADGLAPTASGNTDETGTVKFENLLPGMYLTLSVRQETPELVTVFENFLTALPMPDGTGYYNYDVTARPKHETQVPSPAERDFKVVKQWKDGGDYALRPANVLVDLYQDGVLQETVTLSSENNWMHSWTAPDDGSLWTCVERQIPDGYTVTVVQEGNTFVLTNAHDGDIPTPPTGDSGSVYGYVLFMGLAGLVMILLSVWRKKAAE